MKIGIVIEELDPARGGAQQWTWQFVRWLVAAGHEPHIMARRFADCTQNAGLVLHATRPTNSRLAFGAAAEDSPARLCSSTSFTTWATPGTAMSCSRIMAPRRGAKQNLQLLPAWLRPIRARVRRHVAALPRVRRVVAPAVCGRWPDRDRAVENGGGRSAAASWHPPAQIRLIYNGVNAERFSPTHRSEHRD